MRHFHIFKHQLAAAWAVKGKHYSAEFAQRAEAAGYTSRQLTAVDGVATQSANHCTIGRDEGRIRSETEAFKERDGVVGAAAGGDDDRDSRMLRGFEGAGCPIADLLREGRQERAVHIDGDQANGRVHRLSVPSEGDNRITTKVFAWMVRQFGDMLA
jgi:hypothetical protein